MIPKNFFEWTSICVNSLHVISYHYFVHETSVSSNIVLDISRGWQHTWAVNKSALTSAEIAKGSGINRRPSNCYQRIRTRRPREQELVKPIRASNKQHIISHRPSVSQIRRSCLSQSSRLLLLRALRITTAANLASSFGALVTAILRDVWHDVRRMRSELANAAPELRHAHPVAEAVDQHDAVEIAGAQECEGGEEAEQARVGELEEADCDALQPDDEGWRFAAWGRAAADVCGEVVEVGHAEDEGRGEDDSGRGDFG